MSGEGLIIALILGAVAGWLGSVLYKGSGLGLLGNIVVGILGGWLGYWLFPKLGIHLGTGTVGYLITAGLGALILLALINLIFRGR
ncbi:MAG: GlsB/YeaQ/YmgE family stress response membrane protein [Bacteroidota bacterium]